MSSLKYSWQVFRFVLKNSSLPGAVLAAVFAFLLGYKKFQILIKIRRSADVLKRQLPGPTTEASPLATLYDLATNHRDRLNEYLLENTKKYGRTWHAAQFLVLTTPEDVKHILKDNFENYNKGDQFTFVFHDLLGDGIFNANGENWSVQRKTSSKLFSRKAFSTFMRDTFLHHGQTLLGILDEHAKSKTSFDIQELFYRFTLDSIGQIGFGVDLGVLKKGRIPFSDAFDQSQAHIVNRFLNPAWFLLKSISPEEWRQKERLRLMSDFTQNIINERRKEGKKNHMDILSFFMERTDAEGKPYSEKFLRDIVMNFMIAGRDTTAVTLTWTFYCLSSHPEVERKLLEEIDTVVQGQVPTFDDIDLRLPYLQAVIKEVLRLYPPVPKDIKTTLNDDTLPGGTFVPVGTVVLYTPYVMGRLDEMYDEPLKFDPERWLPPRSLKKTPFEYPVFQAGPRTCLGQHMAFFESKLLTTLILQKYLVRVKKGVPVMPAESLTMPVKNGLPVFVHRRTEFFTARPVPQSEAPPTPEAPLSRL